MACPHPDKFRVDITPYFISLIDPNDPDDPIRRQVIPSGREHQAFTAMMEDSLAEDRHSPVPGLVHRYPDRVLMLVTTQCASLLPLLHAVADRRRPDPELQQPRPRGAARVPAPDAAGPRRPHLRRRRPDARAEALREDPARPARDPAHRDHPHRLAACRSSCRSGSTTSCARCSQKYHPLWINLHFNHPNEITPEVSRAVDKLTKAGLPVGNQSVLLAGVNDCVHIQRALVHQLVANRIRPYYLYQCDLVEGSGHFRTPVGKGLEIMEGLRGHTSGYAVPTYVIDAPGGGGKIPVMPNYLISYSDHKVVLRNYEGYITTYEEPETYQKHDHGGVRVLPARAARSPASPASWACSRASGCGSSRRASTRSIRAATPRRTVSRTRRSGSRSGSGAIEGTVGRAAPVLEAGDAGGPDGGRRRPRASARRELRPRRGTPSARGRADRRPPTGSCSSRPPRRALSPVRERGIRAAPTGPAWFPSPLPRPPIVLPRRTSATARSRPIAARTHGFRRHIGDGHAPILRRHARAQRRPRVLSRPIDIRRRAGSDPSDRVRRIPIRIPSGEIPLMRKFFASAFGLSATIALVAGIAFAWTGTASAPAAPSSSAPECLARHPELHRYPRSSRNRMSRRRSGGSTTTRASRSPCAGRQRLSLINVPGNTGCNAVLRRQRRVTDTGPVPTGTNGRSVGQLSHLAADTPNPCAGLGVDYVINVDVTT